MNRSVFRYFQKSKRNATIQLQLGTKPINDSVVSILQKDEKLQKPATKKQNLTPTHKIASL